jgi:hypothetical protein
LIFSLLSFQVLESMPQIPIHVTEIKKLILKDQISPDTSLNEDQLLNVLTSNACGRNPTFFKAFGHREVFGLKSSIPEGGTTVEIVEPVPVVETGGVGSNFADGAEIHYRQEGVLYVHLPDGHPVITGSGPSDDEEPPDGGGGGPEKGDDTSPSQGPSRTDSAEPLSLDPLNMEAEIIIGEVSPNLSSDDMEIVVERTEDPERSEEYGRVNVTTSNSTDVRTEPRPSRGCGPSRAVKNRRRLSDDAAAEVIILDEEGDSLDELKWQQGRRRVGLRPSSRAAITHHHRHAQHGLKQQAKRRKKNTNVAAGIALPSPALRTAARRPTLTNAGEIEIPFRPFPEELAKSPKTMKEVLGSIPGFNMRRLKLNSRPPKKMSCAQLIQQTREGAINLESPDSILSQVNLRTLLNKTTFSKLPPLYQFKLMQLLPQARVYNDTDESGILTQGGSGTFTVLFKLHFLKYLTTGTGTGTVPTFLLKANF